MAYLTEKKFSFESSALDSDTFAVVHFKGAEALSRPYEFEITLVTEQSDIDLNSVLQQPARFTFHRETGGDVVWNGIVAQFEQLHNFNIYTFYRAVLVPKLWWLQLTYHNQIFLNKSVKQIIEAVLKDGGLTSLDFGFKLQNDFPKIDYVCQYEESHYDFLSRWMEREGLYYYFEQTENGEKVIFTDTKMAHTGMPLGDTLYYSPPSGLDTLHRTEIIQSFTCRQKLTPSKVFLKDYNYETPSLAVTGSAPVDPGGRGDVYYYGENFKTPAEGNRLAKIRSEEILCSKEQYIGESTVPFIMPGYCFKLEDHYRSDFNKEYLTISVDFSGSQTGHLISGIKEALSEREQQVYYSNTFTAIPYSVQFRTERRTKKSKIYGMLPAKIDAAGNGEYAELDSQGRYKAVMPFDQSGRKGGKASIWLRMAQPYAGVGHGMHFPLHKGTEVMIAFTDGDPDRPIIAGAVPNPETASMVNVNNQTASVIQTAGKNKIAIEDKAGSERILLHSPRQSSFIRIGVPNDPPPQGGSAGGGDDEPDEFKGIKADTADGFLIKAGAKNEWVMGMEGSAILGGLFELVYNPLSLIRQKGKTFKKSDVWWGLGNLAFFPAVIIYETFKEMKDRGFDWWDTTKFIARIAKAEANIGNEFIYHQGDVLEVGGEFKRNTKGLIEHRSDEGVKCICDGGDTIAPPNQLHHNTSVDTKGVSLYGKKIHLKSNADGKAQKVRRGDEDAYVEKAPIREMIMSQTEGIRLEHKPGAQGKPSSRLAIKDETTALRTQKDATNYSGVATGSSLVMIMSKKAAQKSTIDVWPDKIEINGWTFKKLPMGPEFEGGALKVGADGTVKIG